MRLTKIPLPLLIAALVVTTAVVIHLQLTVVSAPPVVDSNFTGTLVKGSPYLWRGAASEISITSNATIQVTYMPVAHVVYLNGPFGNVSFGRGIWMIYLTRPLLIEKVAKPDGTACYFVFRLVNVSKVNGLTVLVPEKFRVDDTLTHNEFTAITAYTGANRVCRVVNIYTNGTHIMLDVAPHNSTSYTTTHHFKLPPAVATTSTKITSTGYGVSYKVGNITVSAYVMPYQHVVIIPNATARVTITVR